MIGCILNTQENYKIMKQINLSKINWTRIGVVIILIISISLNWVQCEKNKVANSNIDALNSELTTYKLDNGQLVTTSKSLFLDNKQLEDLVISKDAELEEMYKNFSKPKTVIKTITITKIDSVDVPFEVRVPCDFERYDNFKTEYYSFDYSVNQNGLKIKNLVIPDSVSIITGTKRKWFLGKETYVVDIMHSNPNIKETSLQHFEINEPKKWYRTDAAKIGGSIIVYEVLKSLLVK